jgi:hypothetical protein
LENLLITFPFSLIAILQTFVDPKPNFLRLLERKDLKIGRPPKRKTSTTVESSKKVVADDSKRHLATDDKSTKRRATPEEPRRRSPKVARSASDEPLTPNIGAFSSENEVFAGPASPEDEYEAPVEPAASLRASPRSSSKATATPTPPKSSPASPDEVYAAVYSRSPSVNVETLANNLYMLNGDDVLDLIDLINDHKTAGMYINTDVEGNWRAVSFVAETFVNDGCCIVTGEFHFDLLTMSDDLLKRLWDFTQDRLHTLPV